MHNISTAQQASHRQSCKMHPKITIPPKKIREPPKNHAPKNYPQIFNVLFSKVDGYQFTNMFKNKQTKIPKPSNFRAFNFETNPALVMAP